ncbi:MAG TPA: putative beta-lysine N-acetyltransferase [Saccharofermentans sp.]|nr:putative beta-lysine N-acetyltransferase [Saccharofermentans sp.]HPQ32294.1 putative beta-lysine N-acetyltransferase [Saccharofermentans sp.]
MEDVVEKIMNSIVHHGQNSNRIYLMKLDESDLPHIYQRLDNLAKQNNYTKIIAKIPCKFKNIFLESGYEQEAFIPKFYNGDGDGCFVCKYFDKKRKVNALNSECKEILKIAQKKDVLDIKKSLERGYVCRRANENDIPSIVDLYRAVFKSYPFPIFKEKYIAQTIKENVIYFGIWNNKSLVAVSSIEMDKHNCNAEMTDFAVLNEYRGNGFALYLLEEMEKNFNKLDIKTAFTIARAKSAGMNITFARKGYIYAGTLINNTDIAGQIESMNVWYKNISV